MPYYPYECQDCAHEFEVVKSIVRIEDMEHCPICGSIANRYIAKTGGFIGASDWDTAHYNPAFGKVFKSNAEMRKEAKRRGWDEVGNEAPEKIHKHFDESRQKRLDSALDSTLSTSLGEVRSK